MELVEPFKVDVKNSPVGNVAKIDIVKILCVNSFTVSQKIKHENQDQRRSTLQSTTTSRRYDFWDFENFEIWKISHLCLFYGDVSLQSLVA